MRAWLKPSSTLSGKVGEETGKEERAGKTACKVPCHLTGFSVITCKREIKIPPLGLLGQNEITAANRRCLLSA